MGGGAINLFQQRGAQPATPSRYKPIWTDRFYQGYYTNRNPMRSPLSVYYAEGWGLGKTDVLIDGINIELSIRLTLIRRPGFIYWSNQVLPYNVTAFYSFRQINPSLANPTTLIVDTTNGPYKLTPTTSSAIFTKSAGAGVTRCLALANTLYMADGVDLLAWQDGGVAPNPRNWGISIGEFSGPTGPNDCGTGSDVPVSGGVAWANPGDIADGTPGTYATCTVGSVSSASQGPSTPVTISGLSTSLPINFTIPTGGDSGPYTATNLGFSVPLGSTILGVVVSQTRQQTAGTGALNTNIQLAGVSSTPKGGVSWTSSPVVETFGSTLDLWGAALTPSIVNSTGFGITATIHAPAPPLSNSGSITTLTVTVYYFTPATNISDYLQASNFSFGLASPTTIQGVVVTLKGFQATATPGSLSVQLTKAGSPVGAAKTNIQMPLVNGTVTLGSPADLWGTTLLAGDVADTGFGVAIQALNSSGTSQTWSMDDVQITLYATGGPPISVSSSSGSFSATAGYKYVAAYGNSNSGHVSSTTPASASTGIFSNKLNVSVALTASTDPQVNQIWVFRTTDGGANYYNLPNSPFPNSTGAVTDDAADSALNILLPAPINSANNPPPAGATIPVYHMGRVWVAVGNVLCASGGPDTITGNGAEAFPPANYWVLQSPITRMYPTASGLVIFCTDRVQFLPNPSTNSIPFFNPQPLVDGLGLLSYDALDIYGSQAYMFTADNQFVSFDMSSGITEIGFPIEDQIKGLSPTAVSAAYHTTGTDRGLFLCNGSGRWWRCAPQQPPDFSLTGPVWSPPGAIAQGTITLMKSIETSDGVRQLLCANNNTVIYRDSSFNTFSDLGSTYEAYGTIGSIVLANPGQLAELGFITADFVRIGTSPGMYVLMDETNGTFSQLPNAISDPPYLYGASGAPLSLYSNRYYFKQSTAGGAAPQPAFCRHMQIRFDFGADIVQNEMLSNTIWGSILEEDSV